MPHVALRLPALTENLEQFRAFAVGQAEAWDLSPILGPKLELVLEEVLVNVCSYAYGQGRGDVEMALEAGGDGALTMVVRDWGRPFDPLTEAREPDLEAGIEERGIGGLGIHFVRQMAREVSYRRNGEANELTVVLAA